MKKTILIIAILGVLILSACSLEGESPVYNHLQNQDPSGLNRDVDTSTNINPKETEDAADNPRCLGQYTTDDITYRDYEIRAKIEKNVELCYEIPEEPLVISCPNQVTLVYYSQSRCIELAGQ